MAPTRKSYDAVSDDEETVAPTPKRTKTTKKGARPVLQRPLWNPKGLAFKALRGIDAQAIDELFLNRNLVPQIPGQFRLRIVRDILSCGPDNNPVAKVHGEQLERLKESLEAKYGTTPHLDVPTTGALVLSAWLGCAKAADPKDAVTEGTVLDPDMKAIKPDQREVCELQAFTMAPRLVDAQGTVRCFCKEGASFKQQQAWDRSQKPISYYVCTEGRCRLNITVDALGALGEMMNGMNVENIPVWFCPSHPDQQIKITLVEDQNGDTALKARCAYFNPGPPREFCVSQMLGPDGEKHQMTGAPIWKTLDAIARAS